MEETGFVQSLMELVAQHHVWGAVVLFLSSLIEYVFPPFPGDMVTLFGTFLVVKGLWSFPFALLLTTSGSLLGATADYWLGVWLGKHLDRLPSEKAAKRWTPLTIEKYHLITERFERHGALYICLNRFLPGIRAFFFVVAGAARMPLWKVLLYAGISACLWNALILGVGLLVGENWDQLKSWFQSYSIVMWSLIGVVLLAGIVFWLVRKRKRASS